MALVEDQRDYLEQRISDCRDAARATDDRELKDAYSGLERIYCRQLDRLPVDRRSVAA